MFAQFVRDGDVDHLSAKLFKSNQAGRVSGHGRSRFRILVGVSVAITVAIFVVSCEVKPPEERKGYDHEAVLLSSIWKEKTYRSAATSTSERDNKLAPETTNSRVLNVHVVPHTHDDVGWLKTVEQYYFGWNETIQKASVENILDSVVASLLENEDRTFTYVESKFFSMWWARQNDAVRDAVRYLVANKQLSFANGGWCMHDEATTHYIGMIDQTTLGHSFLKQELGVVPTVGWQLDPFGHSSSQASLMTSKMGFDALYFARIDYQELALRQLKQGCEGLWNASRSFHDSTVFWGLTGSCTGGYQWPKGFCFDKILCKDPSLLSMNNARLSDSIGEFLRLLRVQSDRTQGNHIMLTMGEDFQYQRAGYNFANLDKLIGTIKRFQEWNMLDMTSLFAPRFDTLNIFYSSPECYTKCKHKELNKSRNQHNIDTATTQIVASEGDGVHYGIKTDDFFPYSDQEHGFWTGYFTSRASLKRQERLGSAFLLAARQIESLVDIEGKASDPQQSSAAFHELEDAIGVLQHHDGVSGTAKQHVSNDYSRRLQSSIDSVQAVTTEKLRRLFLGDNVADDLFDLSRCQLLNETVCSISQNATMQPKTTTLYVIVYNGLGQPQSSVVFLPISHDGSYTVGRLEDSTNGTAAIVASMPSPQSATAGAAKYVLPICTGALPALGASVFKVDFLGDADRVSSFRGRDKSMPPASIDADLARMTLHYSDNGDVEASNGLIQVLFDGTTGSIKRMGSSYATLDLSQEWGYYTSWDSALDSESPKDVQNSGAYIFRPSRPDQKLQTVKASSVTFHNTSGVIEVRIEYDEPWIQSTYRMMPDNPYLEVEYTVGPIPVGDGRGKEIVTRLSSPIKSSGTFYTDSNGRDFMQRVKNYRSTWDLNVFEPVAGNYYPVNAAIYVEDSSTKEALTVVTDRTQGGASLQDGSIELMVHRRTLADDNRGVSEPMNETDGGVTAYPPYGNATRYGEGLVIRGKHRILVGGAGGATLARSVMDQFFAEPLVFVGSSTKKDSLRFQMTSFTGVVKSLPPNIMLITRKRLTDETSSVPTIQFLIRVGHQYGLGEDEALSTPAQVDLADCLPGYNITNVEELTLSANQNYDAWAKSRLDWTGAEAPTSRGSSRFRDDGTTVEVKPLDIRTFRITVSN